MGQVVWTALANTTSSHAPTSFAARRSTNPSNTPTAATSATDGSTMTGTKCISSNGLHGEVATVSTVASPTVTTMGVDSTAHAPSQEKAICRSGAVTVLVDSCRPNAMP